MKKKLISLVFGLFMAVFSVFSLSSCSLVTTNNKIENNKTVLKIGDVELTKSDVVNSFYTYYQNNNSYFSYYDNETIEESFYTWAIIKEVINQKSATALYDADTNPNGFIVYTQENEDNVWKNVYNYIYNQVNSYEKNIYKSEGYAEDNYPAWLKTTEAEAEATTFEAYVSTMPDGVSLDKSEAVKKSTNEQILNRISNSNTSLKAYLFEHLVETDEDGNETRKKINDIIVEEQKYVAEIEKDKFIENARSQAYASYMYGLVNTANSSGKEADDQTLLNDEVIRVYEAYYESEITTLLQTYYLDEYLISGEDTPLTEKAIAEAFLNDYYADYQTYQFEDAYITTMTASDGASLVLYHYDGQNYFFTVQHILVKNDEHITSQIEEIPGYDNSGSFDYDASGDGSVASEFFKKRQQLIDAYFMASVVNEDNIKDSINVKDYADYYYYDETRTDNNNGYINVVKVEDGDNVKYYEDADNDGVKDESETTEIEKAKVLYLSTDEQILECYEDNYADWKKRAKDYAGYVASKNAVGMNNLREQYEDMYYVFDTVENMINADDSEEIINTMFKTTLNEKIASYLFVELEWLFSSDSLGNKLSNKMGYVMSNYPDEHGSWVAEFADGARDLIKSLKGTYDSVEEGVEAILNGDNSLTFDKLTTKIISTYGYHIIKVENVFESGSSIIDIEGIKESLNVDKIDLNNQSHIDAVIEAMKKTYVCSASNQRVYDYYFDELYTGFVGSSWLGDTSENATSGTYFLKLEYEWLYELYNTDQIEYIDKIGYEELLEAVS